jgi:hypothetical protein
MNTKRVWVLTVRAVLFGVLATFTIIGVKLFHISQVGVFGNENSMPRQFDRSIWLQHNSFREFDNPRMGMVDDLIDNRLKKGFSERQILKILGEPSYKVQDDFSMYIYKPEYTHPVGLSETEARETSIVYSYTLGVPYIDPVS